MGRLKKEGMDYFSLDVDFFSDRKTKILKSRYGADGITLYLYLLCEVYKNGYYLKVDEDFKFIVSDDLNMNSDKVEQVLTFLLERSMFDKQLFQSDAVLTSAGIQRRFQLMVKTRALKNPVTIERYWLLKEEETATFIKVNTFLNNSGKNEDNSRKNTDSSEKNDTKESKENKKIDIDKAAPDTTFSPELEKAFQLFITCQRKNGRVLLPEQVSLLRKELTELGQDDTERLALANFAVARGWKGFYPVKKQRKEQKGSGRTEKTPGNRFNNFHQREYDYERLEADLLRSQEDRSGKG